MLEIIAPLDAVAKLLVDGVARLLVDAVVHGRKNDRLPGPEETASWPQLQWLVDPNDYLRPLVFNLKGFERHDE